MKKNIFRFKGMSLIELLVVISIIGILTAVIIAVIAPARSRARDGKRVSDLQHVATALENYYARYHHYPWYSTTNDASENKDYINLNTNPGAYNGIYGDATPCASPCSPPTPAKEDFLAMANELEALKLLPSVPLESKTGDFGFRYEGGDCTTPLTVAAVLENDAQKNSDYFGKPQYSITIANIRVNNPNLSCT